MTATPTTQFSAQADDRRRLMFATAAQLFDQRAITSMTTVRRRCA